MSMSNRPFNAGMLYVSEDTEIDAEILNANVEQKLETPQSIQPAATRLGRKKEPLITSSNSIGANISRFFLDRLFARASEEKAASVIDITHKSAQHIFSKIMRAQSTDIHFRGTVTPDDFLDKLILFKKIKNQADSLDEPDAKDYLNEVADRLLNFLKTQLPAFPLNEKSKFNLLIEKLSGSDAYQIQHQAMLNRKNLTENWLNPTDPNSHFIFSKWCAFNSYDDALSSLSSIIAIPFNNAPNSLPNSVKTIVTQPIQEIRTYAILHHKQNNAGKTTYYSDMAGEPFTGSDEKRLELAIKMVEDLRETLPAHLKSRPLTLKHGTSMDDELIAAITAYCNFQGYESKILNDGKRHTFNINKYVEKLTQPEIREQLSQAVGLFIEKPEQHHQRIAEINSLESESNQDLRYVIESKETNPLTEADIEYEKEDIIKNCFPNDLDRDNYINTIMHDEVFDYYEKTIEALDNIKEITPEIARSFASLVAPDQNPIAQYYEELSAKHLSADAFVPISHGLLYRMDPEAKEIDHRYNTVIDLLRELPSTGEKTAIITSILYSPCRLLLESRFDKIALGEIKLSKTPSYDEILADTIFKTRNTNLRNHFIEKLDMDFLDSDKSGARKITQQILDRLADQYATATSPTEKNLIQDTISVIISHMQDRKLNLNAIRVLIKQFNNDENNITHNQIESLQALNNLLEQTPQKSPEPLISHVELTTFGSESKENFYDFISEEKLATYFRNYAQQVLANEKLLLDAIIARDSIKITLRNMSDFNDLFDETGEVIDIKNIHDPTRIYSINSNDKSTNKDAVILGSILFAATTKLFQEAQERWIKGDINEETFIKISSEVQKIGNPINGPMKQIVAEEILCNKKPQQDEKYELDNSQDAFQTMQMAASVIQEDKDDHGLDFINESYKQRLQQNAEGLPAEAKKILNKHYDDFSNVQIGSVINTTTGELINVAKEFNEIQSNLETMQLQLAELQAAFNLKMNSESIPFAEKIALQQKMSDLNVLISDWIATNQNHINTILTENFNIAERDYLNKTPEEKAEILLGLKYRVILYDLHNNKVPENLNYLNNTFNEFKATLNRLDTRNLNVNGAIGYLQNLTTQISAQLESHREMPDDYSALTRKRAPSELSPEDKEEFSDEADQTSEDDAQLEDDLGISPKSPRPGK